MKYFISYSHIEKNIALFGNIDIEVDGEIKGINDIRNIEKAISINHGLEQMVVTNWRRFE